MFGCPHHFYDTVVSASTSCLAGGYRSTQGSPLVTFALATCIAPSDTMETNEQEEVLGSVLSLYTVSIEGNCMTAFLLVEAAKP